MAAAYPVSGGEVAYVFEAWGTRWSFAAAWLLAFSYIFTTSYEAISVEWIVSALIPGFGGPVIYELFGQEVRLWALLLGDCRSCIEYRNTGHVLRLSRQRMGLSRWR